MFEFQIRYIHIRQHSQYGQNQETGIDSDAAASIGKRISQRFIAYIPHAMQGSAAEGTRFKFSPSGRTIGNAPGLGEQPGDTFHGGRPQRVGNAPWTRPQKYYRHTGRGNHPAGHRERPLKCPDRQGAMGDGNWKDCLRRAPQTFFKRISARFGRIRKRPKGKPSPQLCQYKLWELQELEQLWHNGSIELCYGDESHLCEDAYVPYGWKFHKEDIYIPSQRGARLHCFAMIDRNCLTYWFTTADSIDADTMTSFLDDLSLTVARKTVFVLDNAPIHRAKKLLAFYELWKKEDCICSSFHRILHNLTLPRYFGECSKGNGFSHVTTSLRAHSFMLQIGHWQLWEMGL